MKKVLKSSFCFNVHYVYVGNFPEQLIMLLARFFGVFCTYHHHLTDKKNIISFSTEMHGRYTFTEVNCGQNSRENRFEKNCAFEKHFKLTVNVYWKCTTNISPFGEISSVWQ